MALGDLQKVYQRRLAGRPSEGLPKETGWRRGVEETSLPGSWNPSHAESLVKVIKNKRRYTRKEEGKHVGASQRSSKGVLSGPDRRRVITGPWKQSLKRSPLSQGGPPAWPSSPTREPAGWALPNVSTQLDFSASGGIWGGALSSPRLLNGPERTIKTKEVVRPPRRQEESGWGGFRRSFLPRRTPWGFPGGSVVRICLPIQETHLIPGPGGFHVTQTS